MEQGTSQFGQALIQRVPVAAWTLVATAFLVLVVVLYIAVRNRRRTVDLDKAVQMFRSLDIEAFRNLVDSSEEAFLRENLSPRKFRQIKRLRAWAALLYAWEVGGAAAALARVGQAAQRSCDPRITASGLQLSENAFRLRLQTLRACSHLLIEILLPDLRGRSIPALADQYERAAETLFLLRVSSGTHRLVRSKNA